MDKIIIIKLEKYDIRDFCKCCESFNCDIDLIDGSNMLDAKDYAHVILFDSNKKICVSINTDNENEIMRFNKIMYKYKVI